MEIKIGNELPSVETMAKLFWGYKTGGSLEGLQESILKVEKTIDPHKIYIVLFLDPQINTPPAERMATFASVLKTSLILVKGLVKQAVEIIKAIEVTPKLLDDSRILVIIDIKAPELRERIKDFAAALTKSQPDTKEERGSLQIETSFAPIDLLSGKVDFERPSYRFSFSGNVDRDLLEFLKNSEIPEELKGYIAHIQLFLFAKSAKVEITTESSKLIEFYADFIQSIKPREKFKLPKMPIIKKVLAIGREVLCARAQVLFAPEPFTYELEARTTRLINFIDELCVPSS